MSEQNSTSLTYPEISKQIGELVERKQKAYGDSFGRSGAIMRGFFPNGVPPEKMDVMLSLVRVVDKLFRVVTDNDPDGESPWRDIAGYSILEVMKKERRAPAVNPYQNADPCHDLACARPYAHDGEHRDNTGRRWAQVIHSMARPPT